MRGQWHVCYGSGLSIIILSISTYLCPFGMGTEGEISGTCVVVNKVY